MKKMRKIRKPNTKNEDPFYWEKVLESWGLGERQLELQEESEETDNDTLEELDD